MKIKDRCPCAMSPLTSRESDVGNRVLDGFSSASWLFATQLCLTHRGPMDCSPLGSSVLGILQSRILEWVAMPSSRGSSRSRDRTWVFCMQAGSLSSEPPGKSFP